MSDILKNFTPTRTPIKHFAMKINNKDPTQKCFYLITIN